MVQMSTCICQIRPLSVFRVYRCLRFKQRNGYLKTVTFSPASFQRITTRTSFRNKMATLRRSPLVPPLSSVLCIWLPKESHRYSRRFPAFYVLPIVGQWSTGSPSPSICRTAPTCLPVLIQTWITVSLAVLLISVSQGTTASLRCISTDNSREFPRSLDFCVSSVYFERNFLVFLGALHFSISRSLSRPIDFSVSRSPGNILCIR